MDRGLYAQIVIDREQLTDELMTSWYKTFTYFEPQKMKISQNKKGKSVKYNTVDFQRELLKTHSMSINSSSNLQRDDENISIVVGSYSSSIAWLTLSINKTSSVSYYRQVVNDLEQFLENNSCIVAYVHSSLDQFMQNNEDIEFYKLHGGKMSDVKLKEHPVFNNEKAIDIEYNPCHSHLCNGIWFGVAWLMWFGNDFFKFIPKEAIVRYKGASSIQKFDNGTIEVKLFDNIEDYSTDENRKRQLEFRKFIGLDVVAHQLFDVREEVEVDPSMEVVVEGDRKYLLSYLDGYDELTTKSSALKTVKSVIK